MSAKLLEAIAKREAAKKPKPKRSAPKPAVAETAPEAPKAE